MKQNFENATMKTVDMGRAATAYVFYPANESTSRTQPVSAANVYFENSDTGLGGSEGHDVDATTKTPEDCIRQASAMTQSMPSDGQPKVVVFVHEPQRFDFNKQAVAAQVEDAVKPQKPQGFFATVARCLGPKNSM